MKKSETVFSKLKIALAVGLGAFLMLFALQNMARVELTFLVWTFEARRIVLIALAFSIGFVIGWVIKAAGSQKRAVPPGSEV